MAPTRLPEPDTFLATLLSAIARPLVFGVNAPRIGALLAVVIHLADPARIIERIRMERADV
jgi:hypothetical protein